VRKSGGKGAGSHACWNGELLPKKINLRHGMQYVDLGVQKAAAGKPGDSARCGCDCARDPGVGRSERADIRRGMIRCATDKSGSGAIFGPQTDIEAAGAGGNDLKKKKDRCWSGRKKSLEKARHLAAEKTFARVGVDGRRAAAYGGFLFSSAAHALCAESWGDEAADRDRLSRA